MNQQEVKIQRVSNGLLIIYKEPVVGATGVGAWREAIMVLEDDEKQNVVTRLVNFLGKYFRLDEEVVDGTKKK